MSKFLIPPTFLFLSLTTMGLCYAFAPTYAIIPFPFNLLGVVISFFGVFIMGKSRELFKKHETTLKYEKSTFLVKEGVFSKSRNPMYVGMILLLLGFGIVFGNLFSVISVLLFFLPVHFVLIPREEKWMEETFGHEYIKYKKKVRRWI